MTASLNVTVAIAIPSRPAVSEIWAWPGEIGSPLDWKRVVRSDEVVWGSRLVMRAVQRDMIASGQRKGRVGLAKPQVFMPGCNIHVFSSLVPACVILRWLQ